LGFFGARMKSVSPIAYTLNPKSVLAREWVWWEERGTHRW